MWMETRFKEGRAVKDKPPSWSMALAKCMHLFQTNGIPGHQDIEFLASFFKVYVVVSYTSADPAQCVGDKEWPHLHVSNVPAVDGAGQEAAHFRFIWSVHENVDVLASPSPESELQQANVLEMLC